MPGTPALGRQGEPHSAQPRFVCICPELCGGGQAGAVPLVRSIADDELLPAARGVSRSERGHRVSWAAALCKACIRPEAAQFFEQLALARILRTPAAGPVYRGARVSTVAWRACLRVLLRRLPSWRRKPRLSSPIEFSRRALCRFQSSFQPIKKRHDQISRQITVCSAVANLAGILRDSGSGCARSAAAALNIGT